MVSSVSPIGVTLTFSKLKAKQRAVRDAFPESLGLRVHRAISWLGRAEKERDDSDVRFILLWVGFNSAYAGDLGAEANSERGVFSAYFDALVSLDTDQRIYNAVWNKFSKEIRLLVDNKYVFAPFWKHQNGIDGYNNWAASLAASRRTMSAAMDKHDTPKVLSIVFDRLYVLRNQLIHGGATWNSEVNRYQVQDGSAVIGWLLPVFIDIMMDSPSADWGRPFYPVVD